MTRVLSRNPSPSPPPLEQPVILIGTRQLAGIPTCGELPLQLSDLRS